MDLLGDKTILAHRGFFNRRCRKSYQENSVAVCTIATTKDQVGIIELDVRKSKDGILYCYHGSLWKYFVSLKFPKPFSTIQKNYGADSLTDILKVITDNKIVLLDIKDHSITKTDVLNAFAHKHFKEVMLGNKSVKFLDRFKDMPAEFVKIMNGNILCAFYDLPSLKRKNYKYIEVVFPCQIRRRIIDKIEHSGLQFLTASLFFISQHSYWRKINQYGIKHVSSDFVQ